MNGLTPPKAGTSDWPPGPSPRAARGAPEPSDAFAGILDSHQARTATAEGHDKSPATGRRNRGEDGPVANDRAEARSNAEWARERRAADGVERERPVQHHGDAGADEADVPAAPVEGGQPVDAPVGDEVAPEAQPTDSETPAQQAVVVPVAVLVPTAPQPVLSDAALVAQAAKVASVATGAAQPNAAQAVVDVGVDPAATVATTATPAQVATAATAQEGVPADVVAKLAQEGAKPAAPASERNGVATQTTAQPATPGHGGAGGSAPGDAGAKHDQPGTLPQQAADQARTVAQAYGRAQQAQPQTEAPVASAAQTGGTTAASPVAPSAAGQAARGALAGATPVPLSRAAENVEHVVRLASARGVTHARIALNPVELGSIDVHLRQTSEGLMARVVAHAPEAVQQLQQAAADLRRTLEGQGINLLGLDIGHSGDDRSAGRAGAEAGHHDGSDRRGADAGDGSAAEGDETTVKTNLQLPNGVLVDVLA